MNSPLSPRNIEGGGNESELTKSVRDITKQLRDDRIFKGKGVGHLATKGYEWLPSTIIPPDAPCDEWDKALTKVALPQQPEYVTIETFATYKAVVGGIGTIVLTTIGWIIARIWPMSAETAEVRAMLDSHIESYEKRHNELVARLAMEHQENQSKLHDMEARLVAGQATMMIEIHRVGDLLHRYILPRDRRE